MRVDVAIRRGEQLAEIGEYTEALGEYQKALGVNRISSLAHYRVGEVFFLQNNYQSAANEFREALNGDGEPKWSEVWSHINLGKIFDMTQQRERAATNTSRRSAPRTIRRVHKSRPRSTCKRRTCAKRRTEPAWGGLPGLRTTPSSASSGTLSIMQKRVQGNPRRPGVRPT